jgi:hypothetical protein
MSYNTVNLDELRWDLVFLVRLFLFQYLILRCSTRWVDQPFHSVQPEILDLIWTHPYHLIVLKT